MKVALTNVNYTSKIKYVRPKWGGLVFCLLSVLLLLCLLISPAAAKVQKLDVSPSNPTVGDTLKIKGTASPGEIIKAEVSFETEIPVSGAKYQYSLQKIKVPIGKNNRFTVTAAGVQNLNVGVKKLMWINLQSQASEGVATVSQANVPPLTYNIKIYGDALSKKSSVNLIFTASQTLKADSKGRFEYRYSTSSMPAGKFTIKIGESVKTIELESTKQKKPVTAFSASHSSRNTPLKVTFTERSTGSPTSWKWILEKAHINS